MNVNTIHQSYRPQPITVNTTLLENNFYLVDKINHIVTFQGPPQKNSPLNNVQFIPISEFTNLIHTGQVLFLGMRSPVTECWIPYPHDTEIAAKLADYETLIQQDPLNLQYRLLKHLWEDIRAIKTDIVLF